MDNPPFFSIIISTRNRPELFQTALESVLAQSFLDKEVIVVIDGSTDDNLTRYSGLEQRFTDVGFFPLEHRDNGHGQSYTMNYGVCRSSGKYLCFLDDDDNWTDNEYLQRLFESIEASNTPVDLHYSNQKARFSDGRAQTEKVWIEDLIPRLDPDFRNHGQSYFVDASFLLSSKGFAHLNCSVFRRDFYDAIGGMDESIRYENDRDIYIRSIDAADCILYSTHYMSLHNIPDTSKKDNMSTVNSEIEKKLYQLRVYDKGISLSRKSSVIRFCCMAKVYELKHAASILSHSNRHRSAAHYAKAALISGFNLRWLAYTIYLVGKSLLNPERSSREASR